MITLTGKPKAIVGPAVGDCTGTDLSVPPVCEPCRQQRRWMPRTIGWAEAAASRFKAIVTAVLAEHDDILASLCGNCFAQDAPDCGCFILNWQAMGLPMTVETVNQDDCLAITSLVRIPVDCYIACPLCPGDDCLTVWATDPDIPECWQEMCPALCATCELVTFDPCNDPEHLSIMVAAYQAKQIAFGYRGTGAGIVAVLAALFPGSIPQIVKSELGHVYVTLGRAMTAVEQRFSPFLTSIVPLAFGAVLHFVTPTDCPEL